MLHLRVLSADIGGTKIAVGRVLREGRLEGETTSYPADTSSPEAFTHGLEEALRKEMESAGDVRALGVGCAGTVDKASGRVVVSPNLPLRDFPLADALRESLGLPVVLENDANAAVLAEATVGAAVGLRNVVMLTIGTGVGGGLLLDGRLYRGTNGCAAELGHVVVAAGGEKCFCGMRGCLEAYVSGRALERIALRISREQSDDEFAAGVKVEGLNLGSGLAALREAGELTGRNIGRLAHQGDKGALRAISEMGGWLGIGISSFVNIFNPDMVVIGGGLSALGDLLLDPARQVVAKTALAPNRDTSQIVVAALGNQAGVLGAGLLAWTELLE